MKWLSWVIILGSMTLFQVHSGFAWVEITGSNLGWAWAIMFELSAIYFLASGNRRLGIATYLVVLSMASYNISQDGRMEVSKGVNDNAIALAEATLESIKDKPYPITIQKTMATIQELKATNHMSSTSAKVQFGLETLLQIVALFFIMIAQVKAITTLRETNTKDVVTGSVTVDVIPETPSVYTEEAVLADRVLQALTTFGMKFDHNSETAIRNALALPAPTFSRLRSTVETGSGMSVRNMENILDAINRYKEVR